VKKEVAEEVREALLATDTAVVDESKLIGTGCTLLNLAIANNWRGAIEPGSYYWVCGDSDAGKSWLLLSIMAEAASNPAYDKYRLIYDDVENGVLMDVERFFGKTLAARREPPAHDENGNPLYSTTVEGFYANLDDAVKEGTPFIYMLDSMDALDSLSAEKLFDENKSILRNNETKGETKELKANYGDGKAKFNSQNIRRYINKLRDTGSILIIVTQTRDNITGYGAPKIAGGGRALKFYAHVEIWMKPVGQVTKTINKIERAVGTTCQATVKKNRMTGQRADIAFNIYNTYGIDDLGACLDYLIREHIITKDKTSLTIPAMNLSGSREKLIMTIEDENREDELRELVSQTWKEILTKSQMIRKKRYE
jgi:RecA/RadA recombinase